MKQLLDGILDTAIAITRAEVGNIQILDPESHLLKIVTQRGLPEYWLKYWADIKHRGSSRLATVQAVPLLSAEGHIFGMLSTHFKKDTHLSQMHLRELDVFVKLASLTLENLLKTQNLVSEYSHELKTPLTAILLQSQILQSKLDDRAIIAKGLLMIETNAKHQKKVIEDLLKKLVL